MSKLFQFMVTTIIIHNTPPLVKYVLFLFFLQQINNMLGINGKPTFLIGKCGMITSFIQMYTKMATLK